MQELKLFESSFFSHGSAAWGKSYWENIDSINTFKASILDFGGPRENSVLAVQDVNDVKLLTRLRLDFSYLNEHKFRQNFNDIISAIYLCSKETETTPCYLLCHGFYSV